MPTRAYRQERHWELRATVALIGACIVLSLLGFARLYTVTQDLRKTQAQTCQLRLAGRISENTQVRGPLRAALAYLANAVLAGERANPNPDPAKHKAAIDFADTYLSYSHAILLLPNPAC